jgi:hypothetical protein
MGGVGKTAICRELMHHATNPANTMLDVTVLYKQVKTIDFHLSQLTNVVVTAEHSGNALQHDRQLQLHEHLSKLFQLASARPETPVSPKQRHDVLKKKQFGGAFFNFLAHEVRDRDPFFIAVSKLAKA